MSNETEAETPGGLEPAALKPEGISAWSVLAFLALLPAAHLGYKFTTRPKVPRVKLGECFVFNENYRSIYVYKQVVRIFDENGVDKVQYIYNFPNDGSKQNTWYMSRNENLDIEKVDYFLIGGRKINCPW